MTERGPHSKPAPDATNEGRDARHLRGDRRRDALLSAGMGLLADTGWAGITHRKVAVRAASPAGLVQYYFGNLAGLRAAIAAHTCDRLIVPAMATLAMASDLDAVADLLARSVAGATSDRTAAALLTQVIVGMKLHPEVDTVVRDALDGARSELSGLLASVDARWTTDDAERAASLAIAVIDGVALHAASDLWAPPGHLDEPRLSAALRAILVP
jgi:DNA-binding transcriptional regulator YbjK